MLMLNRIVCFLLVVVGIGWGGEVNAVGTGVDVEVVFYEKRPEKPDSKIILYHFLYVIRDDQSSAIRLCETSETTMTPFGKDERLFKRPMTQDFVHVLLDVSGDTQRGKIRSFQKMIGLKGREVDGFLERGTWYAFVTYLKSRVGDGGSVDVVDAVYEGAARLVSLNRVLDVRQGEGESEGLQEYLATVLDPKKPFDGAEVSRKMGEYRDVWAGVLEEEKSTDEKELVETRVQEEEQEETEEEAEETPDAFQEFKDGLDSVKSGLFILTLIVIGGCLLLVGFSVAFIAFARNLRWRLNEALARIKNEILSLGSQLSRIEDRIKKLRKELLGSFEITEQSLENLKSEEVRDDILGKLESIKNREVTGKEKFVDILKTTIGEEQTVRFKSLILKHAELVGRIEEAEEALRESIHGDVQSIRREMLERFGAIERFIGIKPSTRWMQSKTVLEIIEETRASLKEFELTDREADELVQDFSNLVSMFGVGEDEGDADSGLGEESRSKLYRLGRLFLQCVSFIIQRLRQERPEAPLEHVEKLALREEILQRYVEQWRKDRCNCVDGLRRDAPEDSLIGMLWSLDRMGETTKKMLADVGMDEGMIQIIEGLRKTTEELLESWYDDLGGFSTDRIARLIGGEKTGEEAEYMRILEEQRARLEEALRGENRIRVSARQKKAYESYRQDDLLKRLIERIDQGKWEGCLKGEILKEIEAGIAEMLDVVGWEEMEIEEGRTDFDARIHEHERSVDGSAEKAGKIVKVHRRGIREKRNGRMRNGRIVRKPSVEVGRQ